MGRVPVQSEDNPYAAPRTANIATQETVEKGQGSLRVELAWQGVFAAAAIASAIGLSVLLSFFERLGWEGPFASAFKIGLVFLLLGLIFAPFQCLLEACAAILRAVVRSAKRSRDSGRRQKRW